ncbi:hypothetical protein EI94DRAFT_1801333 [Lactarius quietus]|nr:hypothetical protein EI94DRAFT_1801333 [Lactarius quietus]
MSSIELGPFPLGMPWSSLKWDPNPNKTGPHPGSSPVRFAVWEILNFGQQSGLQFTLC